MTRTLRRMVGIGAAAAFLLGPGARLAHAYIDPGTGSSMFSMLAVAFGVISTGVALCFTQIKYLGGRVFGRLANRWKRDDSSTDSQA